MRFSGICVSLWVLFAWLSSVIQAEPVHFGSINAGVVSASTVAGSSWMLTVRCGAGVAKPTQAAIATLYASLVAPASSQGTCALTGSFQSRATRLALVCPASPIVYGQLLAALQGTYPKCNVTGMLNAAVGLHGMPNRKKNPPALRVNASSLLVGPVTITSTTQFNVRWGLDRIKTHPLFYDNEYIYDDDGSGADMWIVDTGSLCTHVDLIGHCTWVANTIDSENEDCNGHGTNVASIAAGTVYGVAKRAHIYAVKVLDCKGDGTIYTVVTGLDVVASQRSPTRATVINLSLNAPSSSELNDEVTGLVVNDGIAVVVAAGNSQDNALNYSPSGAPGVLAVGATNSDDTFASDYSNYNVPILAPGTNIIAAWATSNTSVASTTGTSMASPHIAGIIGMLWSLVSNKQDALTVMALAVSRATVGVISGYPLASVPPFAYSRLVSTPLTLTPQSQPASQPPPPPPPPSSSGSGGGAQPLSNQPTDPAPPHAGARAAHKYEDGWLRNLSALLLLFCWLYYV